MANDTALAVYAAINSVTAALCIEGIGKDRSNQQQGYKFRGIDDMYNVIAPYLAKAKLCIFPSYADRVVIEKLNKSGGTLFYVTLRGEFTFVSAEDGSRHTVSTFGEAMDSGDKATNKAMSAALKYALMQTFTIPTEGDNDADSTTHEVRGTVAAAQAVAVEKLAELKAMPDGKAKPAKKAPLMPDMLNAFKAIKEQLGDDEYYRVLGANGFAKSNEIPDRETGMRIYKEMGKALADKRYPEPVEAGWEAR